MSPSNERPEGAPQAPEAADSTTDAAEATGLGGVSWSDDEVLSDGTNGHADAGEADDVDGAAPAAGFDVSVEDLVQDLERVTAEREQFLEASQRLQADFENYRKAVARREVEARERANESLVNAILPVLDACDGALATGATDVVPVRMALLEALTKAGLERIDDEAAHFDPARHEAIIHEPGEGEEGRQVVAEVMRAGYSWKGRVIRPAMVKVRG